jgi:hypothetical protein
VSGPGADQSQKLVCIAAITAFALGQGTHAMPTEKDACNLTATPTQTTPSQPDTVDRVNRWWVKCTNIQKAVCTTFEDT